MDVLKIRESLEKYRLKTSTPDDYLLFVPYIILYPNGEMAIFSKDCTLLAHCRNADECIVELDRLGGGE